MKVISLFAVDQFKFLVHVFADGQILASGPPDSILSTSNQRVSSLIADLAQSSKQEAEGAPHLLQPNETKLESMLTSQTFNPLSPTDQNAELMHENLTWRVYGEYFRQCGSWSLAVAFFTLVVTFSLNYITLWWMLNRTFAQDGLPSKSGLAVAVALTLLTVTCSLLAGRTLSTYLVGGSINIHDLLLRTLLQSPLSWFEITSTGSILERLTREQNNLDQTLPSKLCYSLGNLIQLGIAFAAVTLLNNLLKAIDNYVESLDDDPDIPCNCGALVQFYQI
jgi:hypothetical protein